MEFIIHCKYDELVDPKTLKDYENNPNKHGADQIERLASLFEYHGIRHPIIVDPDRGVIAAGQGRKLSAIRAGIKKYPVVYQTFESDEAFYAFVTSDNAIAEWSELDLSGINAHFPDLGPDFNIDNLGIKNFTLDLERGSFDPDDDEEVESRNEKDPKTCPNCGEEL